MTFVLLGVTGLVVLAGVVRVLAVLWLFLRGPR